VKRGTNKYREREREREKEREREGETVVFILRPHSLIALVIWRIATESILERLKRQVVRKGWQREEKRKRKRQRQRQRKRKKKGANIAVIYPYSIRSM
jgi:hypothetical protein